MKPHTGSLSTTEAHEIARTLGVKPEEVLEMETRLSGSDIALDPTPGADDEAPSAPIAWLADEGEEPSERLERVQIETRRHEGLQQALGKLDARSRRIIEARWLREEDQATLQQLADEYGVSAERIRQIESKALKQMRGAMAEVA
jgi:RNA polymerase sigma-32 factor